MTTTNRAGKNSRTALFAVVLLGVLSSTVGCIVEPVELAPTLENVQSEVFDVACASCHSGSSPAGNLDLSSAEASYNSLVTRPADNSVAYENGWSLVKAGEPDLSFLCRKIEYPGMGEGAPMPPGDEQLNDIYIDLVRRWIEEGAQR